MIFLIIFDIIYLFVWILAIRMNPLKAIIVAAVAALIMPWARPAHHYTGRKVTIQSLAYIAYKKYYKPRLKINEETE
jgi:NADH:ubiquinone oxidoreductase subunit 3 (subunit A)